MVWVVVSIVRLLGLVRYLGLTIQVSPIPNQINSYHFRRISFFTHFQCFKIFLFSQNTTFTIQNPFLEWNPIFSLKV